MAKKKQEAPKPVCTRYPVIHNLKTCPHYFERVERGQKMFEVRKHDRDFNVGDHVHLNYYNPDDPDNADDKEADRFADRVITYVLPGGQFGIEPGYCVLGLDYVRE